MWERDGGFPEGESGHFGCKASVCTILREMQSDAAGERPSRSERAAAGAKV